MIWAWLAGIGAIIFGASQNEAVQAEASSVAGSVEDAVSDAVAPLFDTWTQYDGLYQKYADVYDIDWHWVKAFALNESSNGQVKSVRLGIENPSDVDNSKSSDGKSWGIMQVTVSTAQGLDSQASPVKLNDPEYSIKIGCEYIGELMDEFSEADPRFMEYVVKSYNQGPGNMRKEIAGTGGGFANEYWARWQRNLQKVQGE
jgi:membrane-bound lytic murein transglycosylase MltF